VSKRNKGDESQTICILQEDHIMKKRKDLPVQKRISKSKSP